MAKVGGWTLSDPVGTVDRVAYFTRQARLSLDTVASLEPEARYVGLVASFDAALQWLETTPEHDVRWAEKALTWARLLVVRTTEGLTMADVPYAIPAGYGLEPSTNLITDPARDDAKPPLTACASDLPPA